MTNDNDALNRIARAFFITYLDEFLSMPPEEIQRLCTLAGVDEAGFKAACQMLMTAAPVRGNPN